MLRFQFPIVIIDEDFRLENALGPGHPRLAAAIDEGRLRDSRRDQLRRPSQFAQQQSRASAFILSIDDEEFTEGPELDPAVLNLRKFIQEIRLKNLEIPIYLSTARRAPRSTCRTTSCASCTASSTCSRTRRVRRTPHHPRGARVPRRRRAAVLQGAARLRAGRLAILGIAPAIRAGAFLKSPVGRMFHQFFGENMLRADVCNSVDELGQLLDHTGPIAQSERNAARIFNADHCFFVTNGTSTSNKMVWHHTVAPGDVVVVDRNCHKSILHAIVMTGSIPVFLRPTRNHYGIIGPIPQSEFTLGVDPRQDRRPPCLHGIDAAKVKPRILTLTQSTYDGVLYNTETIKHALDGTIDTLHFDEAWLPHAAFHRFYGTFHAMGKNRPREGPDRLRDPVDTSCSPASARRRRCWCRTRRRESSTTTSSTRPT